jgi:hypothetical protein
MHTLTDVYCAPPAVTRPRASSAWSPSMCFYHSVVTADQRADDRHLKPQPAEEVKGVAIMAGNLDGDGGSDTMWDIAQGGTFLGDEL